MTRAIEADLDRDRRLSAQSTAGGADNVVGIVLAGAYPSADGMFSISVPRPLLPVAQIPVIAYVLRWLRDGSVERATICANSASRAISACIRDGSSLGLQIEYAEDPTPRGPAGCARDAALAYDADTFVVVEATVIPDLDLPALVSAHRTSGAAVTTVVHYAARGSAGESRVATPAGMYVFARRALELVPPFGFQDIKEHLLPLLGRRHERVAAYSSPKFSPRVLNAETYLAVNHWMIERMPGHQMFERWGPPTIADDVVAHPSADIHPTARTIGPAVFGPRVSIGANALIVGPTSLGADTRVADGAVVSRSVIWNDSHVGEHAFVDASVVGSRIAIDAGVALHGEVRMNRVKPGLLPWRLVPHVPPLRPAPARSMADLAIP